MKSLRFAGASCIALSILALAAASAEEPCAKKPCAECCKDKESAKCPVLKAAEAAAARARANRQSDDGAPADTSLVDGLFETRIILGGLTPRIIIQEEESQLGLVVAPEKCGKKSAACADSKTACEGANCPTQKSLAIELEIDCPLAFGVQQACRSGGCATLACEDECPCQPGACRKAQVVQVSDKPCECCTGAQAVAADAKCAGACPCSGEACVGKTSVGKACADTTCKNTTCTAAGPVHGERMPYLAPGPSCSERDACTVKAVTELIDRLGPSVLSGTEFDRVYSFGGYRADCYENPVTIRDELIEHIRALAAEEAAPGATAAACTAYCQCAAEPCPGSTDERDASIEALRFTAMVLDQAVATLEQHNLYDASDRTRELANQLRQHGRQLRHSALGGAPRRYEAAPASCDAPLPSGCESRPIARRPAVMGGVEIR